MTRQGNKILKLAFVTFLHCTLFPGPTASYPAAFPVCIPSTCQPWIIVYVHYCSLSLFPTVWHWNVTVGLRHLLVCMKCQAATSNIPLEFKSKQTHLASCLPCINPSPSTASTAPFSILLKGLLTETCAAHSFFNRMLFPPSICEIWETLREEMKREERALSWPSL